MKIEKLIPECKDNLWGGEKLVEKYGKQTDKRPCAGKLGNFVSPERKNAA